MAEYIDRKALGIGKCNPDIFEDKGYARGWNSAIEIIEEAPTVDAVEVVRCKDCLYNENGICVHSESYDDTNHRPDYFCADGLRKEDENGKL